MKAATLRAPDSAHQLALLFAPLVLLAGCGGTSSLHPGSTGLKGRLMGGQLPISGASVELYEVGNTGYGTPPTALLAAPLTTDSNGDFTIAAGAYTCPAGNPETYIVASGGIALSGGSNNSAIVLMAALGPCQSDPSIPFIVINEVTTIASVWTLAPFMNYGAQVGTLPTNTSGLADAFTNAGYLADITTGASPGPSVPEGITVPAAEIYTMANILSYCVNSSGTTPCNTLFADTTPSGGTAPQSTFDAALNMVRNPALNVGNLFALSPASPPFEPALTSAPADWSLGNAMIDNPVPAISSLSPQALAAGAAPQALTINGSGFLASSTVTFNGASHTPTYVNSTQLTIALTTADLASAATDPIVVSNPRPGGGPSAAANFIVAPLPIITGVTIASVNTEPACSQLQVTITGQNFTFQSTAQANGVALQQVGSNGGSLLTGYLPAGFLSQPGSLSFTVTNPYPSATSNPFAYAATAPAELALCTTPPSSVGFSPPPTVYAGTSFSFLVQPSEVNVTGSGRLTLGSLPSGITTSATTVNLPSAGTALYFQAASTTAAGSDTVALSAAAGSATATGTIAFTVSTAAPPAFYFGQPSTSEVGVPIGGTGQIQFSTAANGANVDYDVTPSVSGLPAGTTAAFSPNPFIVGQSLTVTLSAASNAPVAQNQVITLTGTPAAQVPPATVQFFADVTQPPGSLPGNRSDFVSTAGTPYAAVYDPAHNLIFSSNPSWNRVDVISNQTHKIVKSIPVRSPRGIDITPDDAHVWVQAASQNVYEIDTATLQASTYWLPNHSIGSSGLPVQFSSDRILALADGTLFLFYADGGSEGDGEAGIWNPQTNTLTVLSDGTPSAWGLPVRSGDGKHVYAINELYASGMEDYETSTQTLTTVPGNLFGPVIAVNGDGTKLVIGTGANGAGVYDQSGNLLGALPGATFDFGIGPGGAVFSADGSKILVTIYATVLTVDSTSLAVLSEAPSIVTAAVGSSPANGSVPFAVDSQGMVLGLLLYGISFDDSTFAQNYAANQPNPSGIYEYNGGFSGPLAGGTTSSPYVFPPLTPDVWFGPTRGTASISSGELTITSPPGAVPGPVNVKLNFPDGTQTFYPQAFTYSTFPEYSVISGSSPQGGAPAEIIGYGLPQDASGGTVTVGGNAATITTAAGQSPQLSGEPYASTKLSYTFPAGSPGWADLQVSTPIGTGTLPKSVFYAQSVTDYSSTDLFTAVLTDPGRNQVYLTAGDHIDVFSTSSNSFVALLYPAAQGTSKEFTGMALTPDGSLLLVTDLLDGSLAVINPDSPSSTYVIPIAATTGVGTTCATGPLYVAATSNNLAFVTTGGLPANGCPTQGITYIANLQTRAASQSSQCAAGFSADASSDGNLIAIGGSDCVYSVQNSTYTQEPFPYNTDLSVGYGIALSGDANVVGSFLVLGDANGNMLGAVAEPLPLYGNAITNPLPVLLKPRLNDSGSLYYMAYPNYFDVIDVQHALLRMRFSLTETVQNTASSIAIDSGGRYVYLITNQGLTVVDLGAAPLSIGHLSPQIASTGTAVTVRGSGFNSGTTATVGGVAATVTFGDQNTLTLTIPAVSSGPQDIVLSDPGGESYTLENAVMIQ